MYRFSNATIRSSQFLGNQEAQAANMKENPTHKYGDISFALKNLENETKTNRDELEELKKENEILQNFVAKQLRDNLVLANRFQNTMQTLKVIKRRFREFVVSLICIDATLSKML